jgi:hypothetical protein
MRLLPPEKMASMVDCVAVMPMVAAWEAVTWFICL